MSVQVTPTRNFTIFANGNPTEHKQTYRIHLEEGIDGWIVVTSPDLQSLVTQGKSEQDAIINAYEAATLILEESGLKKEFNLVVIEKD